MSEDKKEGGCGKGCPCGVKLLAALIVGAFIFAAGMWFAKSHCAMGHGYCPFTAPSK